MTLEQILAVPTTPSPEELARDIWDGDNCVSYSADGKRLLDAEDRRVAGVTAQLSTEKYRLPVQAFENALTTTASWLVVQVPRAILGYAERRMQDRYDSLRRSLPGATGEQETAILQEMVKIQSAQRRIKQKMGREKNTK